jgi:hypothetical protein
MGLITRISIVLVAAAAVFAAVYYTILWTDLAIGSWKYCLLIGLGIGLVSFVWSLTAPKDQSSPQSN